MIVKFIHYFVNYKVFNLITTFSKIKNIQEKITKPVYNQLCDAQTDWTDCDTSLELSCQNNVCVCANISQYWNTNECGILNNKKNFLKIAFRKKHVNKYIFLYSCIYR